MKKNIPLSNYNSHCTGYQNPDNLGPGYILGTCLEIGKVPISFRHPGSDMLDRINAFDMAEAQGTYLGQVNMITVSSFCGIQGSVWGLDVARHPDLKNTKSLHLTDVERHDGKMIPVLSAEPLLDATKRLIGSREKKRFPILPGSHVPCATKHITKDGPCRLYCALAIGIPENREVDACLLMEDVGELSKGSHIGYFLEEYRDELKANAAKSVTAVGSNQKILYKEIYVSLTDIDVHGGEVGCALIAAPYLALAQNAVSPIIEKRMSLEEVSLADWEKMVNGYYVCNSK